MDNPHFVAYKKLQVSQSFFQTHTHTFWISKVQNMKQYIYIDTNFVGSFVVHFHRVFFGTAENFLGHDHALPGHQHHGTLVFCRLVDRGMKNWYVIVILYGYIYIIYTLWLFNIAMV